MIGIAIVLGLVVVLIIIGVTMPDRVQRFYSLSLSAYRHKKQIDQGIEKPVKLPAGFTISEPRPAVPDPRAIKSRGEPADD